MDQAEQTMRENIEKISGKPFTHWVDLVKASKLEKHGEIVTLLKTEHNFTHGYANLIAHASKQSNGDSSTPESLIEEQYKGDKMQLFALYRQLSSIILSFGTDIQTDPKKAYVSFKRKKQFAIVQPSTKTRLDIGLNIKGKSAEGKLELSGSFSAMCSHRIRIESKSDIDKNVTAWLREAYDNAG